MNVRVNQSMRRIVVLALSLAICAVYVPGTAVFAAGKTGVYKFHGTYRYYKKGKIQYKYTGFASRNDRKKTTFLFKKGKVYKKTGLVNYKKCLYKLSRGELVKKTAIVKYRKAKYYVNKNGCINFKVTGIKKVGKYKWYVKKNKIQKGPKVAYDRYIDKSGKVDESKNGVVTIGGTKYLVEKGWAESAAHIRGEYLDAKEYLESEQKDYEQAKKTTAAVEAKKNEMEKAKAALKQEQVKYNAVTFFNWIGENYSKYKQDAQNAVEILTKVEHHESVHLDDPDDAAAIENLKYVVPMYNKYLDVRKNDENADHSVIPQLSLEAISSAVANVDWSRDEELATQILCHSGQEDYLENLAGEGWIVNSCDGSDDWEKTPSDLADGAFDNWCSEKPYKGGHYMQIISNHKTVGFGVTYYNTKDTKDDEFTTRNYLTSQTFGDNEDGEMSYYTKVVREDLGDGWTSVHPAEDCSFTLSETPMTAAEFAEMYDRYYKMTNIDSCRSKVKIAFDTYQKAKNSQSYGDALDELEEYQYIQKNYEEAKARYDQVK